jgi:hypothetical protein
MLIQQWQEYVNHYADFKKMIKHVEILLTASLFFHAHLFRHTVNVLMTLV